MSVPGFRERSQRRTRKSDWPPGRRLNAPSASLAIVRLRKIATITLMRAIRHRPHSYGLDVATDLQRSFSPR